MELGLLIDNALLSLGSQDSSSVQIVKAGNSEVDALLSKVLFHCGVSGEQQDVTRLSLLLLMGRKNEGNVSHGARVNWKQNSFTRNSGEMKYISLISPST